MVAVDVMGGDFSPHAVLQGAYLAAQNNIPVTLFGPEEVIVPFLSQKNPYWQEMPLSVMFTSEYIKMDEEPVSAVRKYKDASLIRAVESVKKGLCDTVLSAGNSGALMVASMLILGKEEGVERLPIAGLLPTKKGKVVVLDLGANTECRAQHLVKFAELGVNYARQSLGVSNPRVALLANGHEDNKGSMLVKETFLLLKQQETLNFIGNVEPDGVFSHATDVVITDGFSGNILLKTVEAAYDFFADMLQQHIDDTNTLKEIIQTVHKLSPKKEEAGALLLGVKGNVVVCHGNSDAITLYKAITFAHSLVPSTKLEPRKVVESAIF